MPTGIVSLLSDDYRGQVEILWQQFKDRFGISYGETTPHAHFSYHVAADYDTGIDDVLADLACEIEPFSVQTAGLGIFTGEVTTLYIALVRDPQLSRVQQRIYEAVRDYANDAPVHYQPDNWVPHITLADGIVSTDTLPRLVQMLHDHNFHWSMTIDSVALLHADDDIHNQQQRIDQKHTLRQA